MTSDVTLPTRAVLDSTMAYREAGRAEAPIALFLHGNPTSSYIWRNVLPHVAPVAHCIAPDLIGFGQSGKPAIAYRFADHVRYLDAFIAASGITSAYLVAQDWGTALAFHLAARRPEFVRGLASAASYGSVPGGTICRRTIRIGSDNPWRAGLPRSKRPGAIRAPRDPVKGPQ
ncbi:MAG TPA: alpha/beta fold hydrolase [Vicinamibacterales bacterium]